MRNRAIKLLLWSLFFAAVASVVDHAGIVSLASGLCGAFAGTAVVHLYVAWRA